MFQARGWWSRGVGRGRGGGAAAGRGRPPGLEALEPRLLLAAPAAPVVTVPTAPTSSADTRLIIEAFADPGATLRAYDDRNGDGQVDAGDPLLGEFLGYDPPGRYVGFFTAARDATTRPLVTATDAAGEESAPAPVPAFTNDSTPPPIPVVTGPTAPVTVAATVATITGTTEAGSTVFLEIDADHDGLPGGGFDRLVSGTESSTEYVPLDATTTAFRIRVRIRAGEANDFLIAAEDAVGNGSGFLAIPTIREAAVLAPGGAARGQVFLDRNANGVNDPEDEGLNDRVLYLDLDGSGTYTPGEPQTTSTRLGEFAFDVPAALASAPVRQVAAADPAYRYYVDQVSGPDLDDRVAVAFTPFSPVYPVPIVPDPTLSTGDADADADANGRLVRGFYRAVLGRDADSGELAGWAGILATGETAESVAAAIINSPEHRAAQVAFYYQAFLHRAVDPGAQAWVDQLLGGASEQAVAAGILDSAEYQSAHADRASLIGALYLDVLGRVGGAPEVDALLAAGAAPADLVATFVNSFEGNGLVAASLYASLRRRIAPDHYELDPWVDRLVAGIPAARVAAAILAAPEFQRLAGFRPPGVNYYHYS